jgi:uncharacterized protein (UPF0332 family)
MAVNEQTASEARQEIEQYLQHAHEALKAAEDNIPLGHHSTAINRAYYAIFYAANALLATKGLQRSKHSGVIAAFREHFVKPGLIEPQYSKEYGRIMDARLSSDYELSMVGESLATTSLVEARRFVARVEDFLRQAGH